LVTGHLSKPPILLLTCSIVEELIFMFLLGQQVVY